MNLPLILLSVLSTPLVAFLICFNIGVRRGDRADLGSVPKGFVDRMASRVAGLHVRRTPHS